MGAHLKQPGFVNWGGSTGAWGVPPLEGRSGPGSQRDLAVSGLPALGPGRWKVDLETPLETLFKIGIGLSCLPLVIALLSGNDPFFTSRGVVFGSLGALVFFLFAYTQTDNYYVLDLPRKAFRYHFRNILIEGETELAPFRDVLAVGATSVRKNSKHRHWHEYAPVVVLKSGQMIRVGDFERDGLGNANVIAAGLSRAMGCRLVRGQSDTVLTVRWDDHSGCYLVTQEKPNPFWQLLFVLGFLLVALLLFQIGR